MRISFAVILAIGCTLGPVTPEAQALLWEATKDWRLYGNLKQGDVPGIGPYACGPTAAVNSFVYLETAYRSIYDNSLTPRQGTNYHDPPGVDDYDDMIAAAVTLGGSNYMRTQQYHTTWHDLFIWGKRRYIELKVPGKTVYQAQDHWTWSDPALPRPSWVSPLRPTWNFIYTELAACEDVEVLLSGVTDLSLGHYVTLTRFRWDDYSMAGSMHYIDPATGTERSCFIWREDGQIRTNYWGYGGNVSWISMAVSESPIPEPSTLLLLIGPGLIGVIMFRKRRVR